MCLYAKKSRDRKAIWTIGRRTFGMECRLGHKFTAAEPLGFLPGGVHEARTCETLVVINEFFRNQNPLQKLAVCRFVLQSTFKHIECRSLLHEQNQSLLVWSTCIHRHMLSFKWIIWTQERRLNKSLTHGNKSQKNTIQVFTLRMPVCGLDGPHKVHQRSQAPPSPLHSAFKACLDSAQRAWASLVVGSLA